MHEPVYREEEKGAVTVGTKSEAEDSGKQSPIATPDLVVNNSHTCHSYSRTLSHISESSADGVVLSNKPSGETEEMMSMASGLSVSDIEVAIGTPEPPSAASDIDHSLPRQNTAADSNQKQDTSSSVLTSCSHTTEGGEPQLDRTTLPDSGDVPYVARRVSVQEDGCDGLGDSGLEEALGAVVSSLDDYRGQFPELQLLEQELKLLQVTLTVRTAAKPSDTYSCRSSNVFKSFKNFHFGGPFEKSQSVVN